MITTVHTKLVHLTSYESNTVFIAITDAVDWWFNVKQPMVDQISQEIADIIESTHYNNPAVKSTGRNVLSVYGTYDKFLYIVTISVIHHVLRRLTPAERSFKIDVFKSGAILIRHVPNDGGAPSVNPYALRLNLS